MSSGNSETWVGPGGLEAQLEEGEPLRIGTGWDEVIARDRLGIPIQDCDLRPLASYLLWVADRRGIPHPPSDDPAQHAVIHCAPI